MSFALPDGSVLQYAATVGAPVTVSALSNAASAVATLDNDPTVFEAADVVLVRSAWDELDGRLARLSAAGAANVTLEKVDTSYLKFFATGGGVPASLRLLDDWTEVTQIETLSQSGGEAGNVEIRLLKSPQRRSRKTGKSPIVLTATLHDDVALPWFDTFRNFDLRNTEVPFRLIGEDDQVSYFLAQVSLGGMPTFEADQTRKRSLVLPLVAIATEYDLVNPA